MSTVARNDERVLCGVLLVGYSLFVVAGAAAALFVLGPGAVWDMATGRISSLPRTRFVGILGFVLLGFTVVLCAFYWRRLRAQSVPLRPRLLWFTTAAHSLLVIAWFGFVSWEEKLYLEPGLLALFCTPVIIPIIALTLSCVPIFASFTEDI